MELKDTVEGMCSFDYKERFKTEYALIKINYEKLKKLLNRIEAAVVTGKEAPKYDCPIELLIEQKHIMARYIEVLELRAEIEQIEL